VLARRLKVARPWLRRLDSSVDVMFYLFLLAAAWRLEPVTLRAGLPAIALLVVSELACMALSLLRFGTLPATHSYAAKLSGLVLFSMFLGVLCFGWGSDAIWLTGLAGLTTNAEILAILLLSRAPPVDVPSVLHLPR
jgi:hypothetical protein